ncbi:uncharacterized protein LOC124254999 [Haliotis rubra]|uniref:uncharacterized protein LOC124254999 n=1 Tax=Haliotis rubra TaxID=36100 RepID=UPI001EE5E818|nr:uncharacterized protein LOC124254999 [Haliotis rubra]XP_046544795.1 uncharacterized protein LOC124254999 [Haliotis rubra]XP_046544796.1 uncharacterized protein LOC124254999 [Haliotis rubra]
MITLFSVCVVMATLPDTTAGGPTQPENMTCVLYAKRLLTCNYDLRDGVDRSNTTCTTCFQYSKVEPCEEASKTRCNTAVGKCEYDCDDLKFCDYFHLMKVTEVGGKGDISASMCRQIETEDYIQPGPVRDLRVTAINSTALRVSWKQPDDRCRLSDPMMYKYFVKYFTKAKNVKKTKSKDEDVEVVLTDLEPWTNYTVTVRSRPHSKGFRGPPQNATNSTLEDVPVSGPLIPKNPYSRVAPGVLEVYWSSVPRDASRGVIVNYSVHASCCLSQPLYTTDHSTTINITGHSNVTVRVNAATKIGWSKTASQVHVYRRNLDVQFIDRVQRSGDKLSWVFHDNAGKQPDFFNVCRCFGSQDDKLLQLVKCRGQVNTIRVPGNKRALPLEDHVPPKLACAGCDWQYAVSAHVDNVTSPMVWNTPLQHFETRPSASAMTDDSAVITALVIVVVVVVGVGVAVVVVKLKRNVLCERFKIQMPQLMWSISDKEEPCTWTEDDRNGNAKGRQGTPQVMANTIDVLEEDGQRVPLLEEQLQAVGMQTERGDGESDTRFLTDSVGSNYKQVTIDTGKSPSQDCLPCSRDRSVSHNSTRKHLNGRSGPGLNTPSLSVAHDCTDVVRQTQGLCQGNHIHLDVICGPVGSPDEDEGWSSSSDSGVSTYRQVPIDSDVSQSLKDCQPDESATTVSEDEAEHDSAHSSISHMIKKPVSEQLQGSSSYSSVTHSSVATAPPAPCQISTSSTEVKLHPCRQPHADFRQSVPPTGTVTSIPNSFVLWEAADF